MSKLCACSLFDVAATQALPITCPTGGFPVYATEVSSRLKKTTHTHLLTLSLEAKPAGRRLFLNPLQSNMPELVQVVLVLVILLLVVDEEEEEE